MRGAIACGAGVRSNCLKTLASRMGCGAHKSRRGIDRCNAVYIRRLTAAACEKHCTYTKRCQCRSHATNQGHIFARRGGLARRHCHLQKLPHRASAALMLLCNGVGRRRCSHRRLRHIIVRDDGFGCHRISGPDRCVIAHSGRCSNCGFRGRLHHLFLGCLLR
jgi:hypothetical protein